ncbi:MAG: hypothetical protein E5Y55_15695 [Mesorhizobium sp.]|nr:MAG: hypothetical protein E5Y55_15695 [Mesorhizobium sp.]
MRKQFPPGLIKRLKQWDKGAGQSWVGGKIQHAVQMPAIVFGTQQLPYRVGNRLPLSCVKLCHVRVPVALARNSAAPKWFRRSCLNVIGPSWRGDFRWPGRGSQAVDFGTALICATDLPPRRFFYQFLSTEDCFFD